MRVRREYERKNPPNSHMHDMDKECMTAVTDVTAGVGTAQLQEWFTSGVFPSSKINVITLGMVAR